MVTEAEFLLFSYKRLKSDVTVKRMLSETGNDYVIFLANR